MLQHQTISLENTPRLAYKLLKTWQQELHSLMDCVSTALLWEKDKEAYFNAKVEPLVNSTLDYLRGLYGSSQPALRDLSAKALCWELLALEHLFLSDMQAALDGDPSCTDPLEVLVAYPGFMALRYHRVAHVFYRHKLPLLPRLLAELAHSVSGIDIHPGAQIGASCFIDHGSGVVIGETAILGKRVTLFQGVTLGAKTIPKDKAGRAIKGQPRHPIIGDDVTLYAGAAVLGRVEVGAGSVIGGNVWLTHSVPAGSQLSQAKAQQRQFSDGDGI